MGGGRAIMSLTAMPTMGGHAVFIPFMLLSSFHYHAISLKQPFDKKKKGKYNLH